MVSTATMTAVIITFCVSTILPIGIFLIYGFINKGKGTWSAWFLGAAGFFVMQIVIRTSLLNLFATGQSAMDFASQHYVLYCFLMAFTAALSEVIGRYAVAKLMRKNLTCERGIAAGLGHGGIEAIIIIGMTYLNNLVYISLINSGSFDTVVEQTAALGVDTSPLLAVKNSLLHTGPSLFLMAGYERILTMILHVALSLTVCYYVSRREDLKGILLCLLCHCIVDFTAPFVNGCANQYLGNVLSTTAAYVIIYVFLTIAAAISIFAVMKIKKAWGVPASS